MKHSKRFKALVGGVVLGFVLCVVTPLNTMISQKSTSSPVRRAQPVQPYSAPSFAESFGGHSKATKGKPRYKSDIVWVKTSDNATIEIPQWQIDQMKTLQQKGDSSKDNPIDASIITSEDLALVSKALTVASNLNEFRLFCGNLTQDQQTTLVSSAFTLEMQGLASLLMTYIFPKEVQSQMGASIIQEAGIIAPVVKYLQDVETVSLNHKGPVKSVAFSPDGNRIISGAAGIDHNLILYDLKHGKEVKNLIPETFPEPCVAFSPDGKYIVAGAKRLFENPILFDGVTGERIKIFGGNQSKQVNCIVFSPDSNSILAGSQFPHLGFKPILYDVKTGKIILAYDDSSIFYDESKKKSFEGYADSMTCAAFRPNSNDIVLGSDGVGCNLNVYDYTTYKRIKCFYGLSQGAPSVQFSADGKYLVGGTLELILWDAETGNTVKTFKKLGGRIVSVAFHPSGDYVVAAYNRPQDNVIIFSCKTGNPIKKIDGMSDVQCVAFSPDGNLLLCGGKQGLMLFKLITDKTLSYIATQLNLAQARLLYRLYLAQINHVPVIMDSKDLDYQLYLTLPVDVQKVVKTFLPFELASDITEKEIQQKMNELRSSLFYQTSRLWGTYEKKRDEKIKAIKDAMQHVEKQSIDYKACERLLIELEQEVAFDL